MKDSISTARGAAVVAAAVIIHIVPVIAVFNTLDDSVTAAGELTAIAAIIIVDVVPVIAALYSCASDPVATLGEGTE